MSADWLWLALVYPCLFPDTVPGTARDCRRALSRFLHRLERDPL